MGIELPSELAGVAATAGVQWPQADEDAMRSSAAAWRQAGQSLSTLTTDADGSASKALAGVQGETATAAQSHWNGFIEPDSGKLTSSVRGCNAAADQLEHAADQVGEAKTQIVAHLVTLAKNTDAAHQAAAAGNPNAMLGLDTAVRGTAANVAQVNANLSKSIQLDGGSTVYGQSSPVNANPGGGTFAGGAMRGGGLSGLEPLLGKNGPVQQTAGNLTGANLAGTVNAAATGPLTTLAGPGAHGGPGLLGTGPGAHGGADGGLLGGGQADGLPVGGGQADGGLPVGGGQAGGGQADGGLPVGGGQAGGGQAGGGQAASGLPGGGGSFGPQPLGPGVLPGIPIGHGGGHGDIGVGSAENTGPIQLPSAPAHPVAAAGTEAHTPPLGLVQQSAYVGPSASPTMQPFAGGAAPAAPIAPAADPGGGQGPVGFAPDAGAMPAAPVQGGAPGWGQQYAGGAGPGSSAGPSAGPVAGSVAGAAPAGGIVSRAPAQYASGNAAVVDQPGGAASHSVSRPSARRSSGPRDPAVAMFLVYMFPIGHLPVASGRPARQLPLPAAEEDFAAGSRFEPHDHPDSSMFDAVTAPGDVSGLTEGGPAPDGLVAEHDPLGGGNETDWERRFVVRPATEDEAAEYAWPPGLSFPEGGCDHGEAVRLAPGTILDRFGGNEGRVFSVPDTPFAARSLPPDRLSAGYHRYEVRRELPMWWALSAAWFGQPGGGVRYRAVYPAADLVALGFLREISVGDEE